MDTMTTQDVSLEDAKSIENSAIMMSRLLCGYPSQQIDFNAIAEEWKPIAQTVASAQGHNRVDAFELALRGHPDAANIRAAVFSAAPHQKTQDDADFEQEQEEESSLDFCDFPELPKTACISDSLARESNDAGAWLNSYTFFASQASPMTPSSFHEVFGLIAIATAIARRVCFQVSTTLIYPNLFALIIAHSTLYRKTTGAKILEKVLKAAGLQGLLLPTRVTPESFLRLLTGQKPPDYENWSDPDRQDWNIERLFSGQRVWLLEEASSLFESFDIKYSAGLLPLVLDLWDCPEVKTVDTIGRGRATIRNAYLSICGITTPAALKLHLNRASYWGNGLWARFALITPTDKPVWSFWPQSIEIPSALPAALRTLAEERLPQPKLSLTGEVEPAAVKFATLGPQVWEQWEAYGYALEYELLIKGAVSPNLHSSYGRLATLTLKVAMLLASVDWAVENRSVSPVITLPHWARAQLIVENWRTSAHRLIATPVPGSVEESLEPKIRRLLHRHPDGLSSRELAIKLSMTKSLERREVDGTLSAMLHDGLLKKASRQRRRGPSAEVWVLVE